MTADKDWVDRGQRRRVVLNRRARTPSRARCQDAVHKYWHANQQDQEEKIELHQPVEPIRRYVMPVMGVGLRIVLDDRLIEFPGKRVARPGSREWYGWRGLGLG